MISNKNGDFTETDGSSYSYEVLAQPSHLLPGGIDKTNREVLHHILYIQCTHGAWATRSTPGTSCMNAGLVRSRCFVLTKFSPEKVLLRC